MYVPEEHVYVPEEHVCVPKEHVYVPKEHVYVPTHARVLYVQSRVDYSHLITISEWGVWLGQQQIIFLFAIKKNTKHIQKHDHVT